MHEALGGMKGRNDTRALVFDSKQDVLGLLESMDLGVPVLTMNPFDARCVAWDIARDVTSPASALQMAKTIIPEEDGNNRFFSDAARDLLCGVMLSFIEVSPGRWTFSDVVYALQRKERLEKVLERTERGRDRLASYFSEERVLHNIMSTIRSRIAPFEPIASLWQRAWTKVSLREWINGQFVLVLASNEAVGAALDSVNQVIFRRLVELTLSQSESKLRRSWFFLDEVREAGKLPGLSKLLTKGRSKGACVALGFQDVHGLKDAYGEHVAAEIIGQTSQKALLRMESPETASWAARVLGEYETIEILRSTSGKVLPSSRTRSEHRVKADAVMPSEFQTIPPTTAETGLSGYFLTPYVGAFKATLPLRDVLVDAPLPRTAPDFAERAERQQYLIPWEGRDYRRLSLDRESPAVERDLPKKGRGKLRLVKKAPQPEAEAL